MFYPSSSQNPYGGQEIFDSLIKHLSGRAAGDAVPGTRPTATSSYTATPTSTSATAATPVATRSRPGYSYGTKNQYLMQLLGLSEPMDPSKYSTQGRKLKGTTQETMDITDLLSKGGVY